MRFAAFLFLLLLAGCADNARIIGTAHRDAAEELERIVYLENGQVKTEERTIFHPARYQLLMEGGRLKECTKEQYDAARAAFAKD